MIGMIIGLLLWLLWMGLLTHRAIAYRAKSEAERTARTEASHKTERQRWEAMERELEDGQRDIDGTRGDGDTGPRHEAQQARRSEHIAEHWPASEQLALFG